MSTYWYRIISSCKRHFTPPCLTTGCENANSRDREDLRAMDEESIYEFDTCGWTLLRGVLTAEEVAAAAAAVTGICARHTNSEEPTDNRVLDDHPTLCAAKLALIGPLSVRAGPYEAYKLDSPPSLLQPPTSTVLCGGRFDAEGREQRSRSYVVEAGIRRCRGLRIVWALEDAAPCTGGIHVISGSHRSNLPTPADVQNGTDTMSLLTRIEMHRGDLLLLSSALLYAVRPLAPTPVQQLLISEVISPMARSSSTSPIVWAASTLEAAVGEPAWLSKLTPQQRAVIGLDSSATPTGAAEPVTVHGTAQTRCEADNICEKELWYFDLTGMLILKGVMDAEWLRAAHQAYEWGHSTGALTRPLPRYPRPPNSESSERLDGLPLAQWTAEYANPLSLPEPFGDPFKKMLAHPVVMSRLDWMLGKVCLPTNTCTLSTHVALVLHTHLRSLILCANREIATLVVLRVSEFPPVGGADGARDTCGREWATFAWWSRLVPARYSS